MSRFGIASLRFATFCLLRYDGRIACVPGRLHHEFHIFSELYKLSPNLEFWIGMDDVKSKGHWVWSDGIKSPGNELPWDEGQPNHAKIATITQECVEMVYFGKFNDEYCILPQTFLCEKA